MSFDKSKLLSVLQDIETYLGYLKGNELAFDYLERVGFENAQYDDRPAGSKSYAVFLPDTWDFPCPDERFRVRPERRVTSFTVWINYSDDNPHPPPSYDVWLKEVQQRAEQAWRDGASWASGIASYAYRVCEQFAEPDVAEMASAVTDLQRNVVEELGLSARSDWAQIDALLKDWSGDGYYAFTTFYNNYDDSLATFSKFAGYIASGFAAATKLVDQTQTGSMKYVESFQKAVVEQLDAWIYGKPPETPPKEPAWVANIKQVAADIYPLLDLVPVVKEVKDKVDTVVGVVDQVGKIAGDLGAEPIHHDEIPFVARDSQDLYTSLTQTLHDSYFQAFRTAMDVLESGARPSNQEANKLPFSGNNVIEQLETVKTRFDWNLPQVTDESLYEKGNTYP